VLLNEPFAEAVARVEEIKTSRGLALGDVARLLCEYVFRLHMVRPTHWFPYDRVGVVNAVP
jgi:hypothetical protein